MASRLILLAFVACFLTFIPAHAQVASSTAASTVSPSLVPSSTASPTSSRAISSSTGGSSTSSGSSVPSTSTPPDVLLNVPNLSVGRIELDVDNLQADLNLNAKVANLVSINAGVAVSVQKVNLTIVNVQAQLELIVRLGHLVDIVNRVFSSLDLNPLLITAINDVTNVIDTVVGEVDGLLGSITQGGTTLSFLIDNLGNIVQEVVGATGSASSIVGNYLTNMTYTGVTQTLQNGLVQKTYSYSPLNALVNIIFNAAGQIVQATVVKRNGSSTSTSSSATSRPTASTGT